MEEQVLHMDKHTTRAMFADLVQVALTLHFWLSHAAKSPKVPLIQSILPEVFANSNPIMKMNDSRHPLSGFVALQQIVNIFNRNPQGTALQMKRRLIKMIDNAPQDSSFSMYKINQLLQDVDLKLANINMKDLDGKKALEREALCCKRLLKRCTRCAETPPRTASTLQRSSTLQNIQATVS
jgi:hypothetical protein